MPLRFEGPRTANGARPSDDPTIKFLQRSRRRCCECVAELAKAGMLHEVREELKTIDELDEAIELIRSRYYPGL